MNDHGSERQSTGSARMLPESASPRESERRDAGPAIICSPPSSPYPLTSIRDTSCGHDFDFHLASWLDAVQSWRHGLFYPHWAPSPNYGAGEPRFVFYPPLTWMLGAAFGLILPWSVEPARFTFSFLAATGLATRMLARQALDDGTATLAGCGALFSGYSMFTAYERSAIWRTCRRLLDPACFCCSLLPRSQSAGLRLASRFRRLGRCLALVIAGAWLSNAPLGVMACYLLAAVALIVALLQRSWAPVIRSAIAVALGLGLAPFYLVPAASNSAGCRSARPQTTPASIENSFLFGRHADPNLELHDVELWRVSAIAVTHMAIAFIGLSSSRGARTASVNAPGGFRSLSSPRCVAAAISHLASALECPSQAALSPVPMALARRGRSAARYLLRRGHLVTTPGRPRTLLSSPPDRLFSAMVSRCSFFQDCDTEDTVGQCSTAYPAGTGF